MAILTISREFGSGGREIGQAVAQQLGYDYVDKARILGDIKAIGGKWEEWGKDLDEHCPTVWERYDWSFRGFGALIQSIILNYALRDRVVILGRGGNFLLHGIPYAYRIRVVAPVEARLQRIMPRESVDRETAQWLVERTDRDRSCFIHALYGKAWDDPSGYDALFNTGEQSLDKVAALVVDALTEKEQFRADEARRTLEMRAAAAQVKAGLVTDPGLFIPTLDVLTDGAHLVVRGIIHNPKEHQRIEALARKLAGDRPLKCALHYRD
jgi:cytidylate kinase